MNLIATNDRQGRENGWVYPVWPPQAGSGMRVRVVGQVYATMVLPGQSKGPHCHRARNGYFACVCGEAELIVRQRSGTGAVQGRYTGYTLRPGSVPVAVLAGEACEIINRGPGPAVLINIPDRPWEQDEEKVEGWDPPQPEDREAEAG